MTLLLHTCCGPCSVYIVESLTAAGTDFTSYFYNPNIHPYTEYQRRLETLRLFVLTSGFDLRVHPEYRPEEYFRAVTGREDDRCSLCYRIRLEKAAETARELGCEAFSTTLLYSRYQKHDLLRATGDAVARETGVPFYYEDFRVGWTRGVKESRRLGIYRQRYCGCLYSERERFLEGSPAG